MSIEHIADFGRVELIVSDKLHVSRSTMLPYPVPHFKPLHL